MVTYPASGTDWSVDVTGSGSQEGLMLPPGVSFNAVSPRSALAWARSKAASSEVFRSTPVGCRQR
jgi:aspartate aminotransferase-like enzyme